MPSTLNKPLNKPRVDSTETSRLEKPPTTAMEVDPDRKERVTIIIPAFNEEGAIADVITKVWASLPDNVCEVIVVDDGSSDQTGELAKAAGARVIQHPSNRGYGASLKSGIRAATSGWVLTMDADGQHRLEDVALLCETTSSENPPNCTIGNRTHLLHSPLWRMPGKWFLTRMSQFLTKKKIPDLNSGLRLVQREIALKYIRLCPQGFSFSTTITLALLSRGYAVNFVPITVEKRVGKSTVSLKTGFDTILLVLRLMTLFNPLRIFLPLSFICFVAGIAWAIPDLIARNGLTVGAMLLIITGVLTFSLGLICDQVAQMRLERYE